MRIDAFGKECPIPMMMVKKEIDAGNRNLSIAVDNDTAVDNITHLGKQTGLSVAVDKIEGGYLLTLSDDSGSQDAPEAVPANVPAQEAPSGQATGYVMFIGKDHVGEGDPELGHNLMKMALYTLSESEQPPSALLFMNSGVKLLTGDNEQTIEHVKALEAKGAEVLACGTCLDFYGLKDDLQVGTVSNMYDILEHMRQAPKVITL